MRTSLLPLVFLLPCLALLAACGGGGGGGGGGGASGTPAIPETEPNDDTASANPLAFGEAGSGSLVAVGDQDYWSFTMAAPGFVRIELLGSRLDQATWDAAFNLPMLTLFDTDGTTVLGEHDRDGDVLPGGIAGAGGGFDRDFACHWLGAAGTYFIRVAQDAPANAGGAYAVKLTSLSLGALQTESEAVGATGGNDTGATADSITIGELKAYMAAGDVDVYAFNVTVTPAIAVFDIKGWQLGGQLGATDYTIVDAQLFASDGMTPLTVGLADSGYGFDLLMSTAITAPGQYFLVVTPDAGQGQPGYYHVHHELRQVGTFTETEGNNLVGSANALAEGQFVSGTTSAVDPDVFSFSATAGDMRSIRVWTANNMQNGGNNAASVTVIAPDGMTPVLATLGPSPSYSLVEWRFVAQQSGTFYARVIGAGGAQPYILRNVRSKSATYESEPNGSEMDAGTLDAGKRAAGVMDAANDQDWYAFTAAAGEVVRFDLFGGSSVSGLDFLRNLYGSGIQGRLTIFASGGLQLAQAQRVGAANSWAGASGMTERIAAVSCAFVAPAAATYYVRVEDTAGASGAGTHYLLERR